MDSSTLNQFATDYTAAWCSQHAASVASFFGEQGSLKINDGAPAIGRTAITNSAQSFMTAFPDLLVKIDRLVVNGAKTEYHWTLMGTNTGPGGTGKFVQVSGYEEWRFGPDGLIGESFGHFAPTGPKPEIGAPMAATDPTSVIDGPEMTARKRQFDAEVMIVAKLQGIRDHTSK